MRVAVATALIADMRQHLGAHSAVSQHKAHLSRDAFSYPFTGPGGRSTCGGSGRLHGWALSFGNTDAFEAFTVRVMVDERQRGRLERCLLATGAATFVLGGLAPASSCGTAPRHFRDWASGEQGRPVRLYYISHAILAVVAALVIFCAGFGEDSRGCGEVVDVSFEVVNGKTTFSTNVSDDQHAAFAGGGEDRAATAHHLGDMLARAHSHSVIGAIAYFKSFFYCLLPSRTYVGVGCDYRVFDVTGRPILMMPDAELDAGAKIEEDDGRCAACAARDVELDEAEDDRGEPGPLGILSAELGPEIRPAMFRDDLSDECHDDVVALAGLSEAARASLPTGHAVHVERFYGPDWPPHAATLTATGPPCSAVHRRQAYVPTLAGHEKHTRYSARATTQAGDLRSWTRRTLEGVVLLLGGLQAGAAALVTDASCLVGRLDADGFFQRMETVFMLETPAGARCAAAGTRAYRFGALVHCAVEQLYDVCHAQGHAFSHAHLADAALLGAATLATVATANIQCLRGGPPRTADRVELVAGAADAAHVMHCFYDGTLGRDAKAALEDRGICVVRRLCDLALREIDPDHEPAEGGAGAGAGAPRPCARRGGQALTTARARAAFVLARLDGHVQACFIQQRRIMPALELDAFKKFVFHLVVRVMAAAPAGLALRCWDWVLELEERLAADEASRTALGVVGQDFFDAVAVACTGRPRPLR